MHLKSITLCLLFLCIQSACQAQELRLQQQNFERQHQTNGGVSGQTLIVSQNSNGQGIRVIDRLTNRQLVDTSNLQEVENDADAEEDLDGGLVAGLLDWFEKLKEKKRKKKGKKNDQQQQPFKQPIILPIRPDKHERKEIHIHINNHIKKHDNKHKQNSKHHEHHHHKKHGHYEDYHEGHYGHDDHYHGKHSYPLLGHHFGWGFDHFGGDHYGGHSGGGHDDYSGYESKKIARYAAASSKNAPRQRTTTASPVGRRSAESAPKATLASRGAL